MTSFEEAEIKRHTFHIIDELTKELVKEDLVEVVRRPSETVAYLLNEGYYKVLTSNGESFCHGPVWILWDTSGYPYPVTPEEFNKLYIQKEVL